MRLEAGLPIKQSRAMDPRIATYPPVIAIPEMMQMIPAARMMLLVRFMVALFCVV